MNKNRSLQPSFGRRASQRSQLFSHKLNKTPFLKAKLVSLAAFEVGIRLNNKVIAYYLAKKKRKQFAQLITNLWAISKFTRLFQVLLFISVIIAVLSQTKE